MKNIILFLSMISISCFAVETGIINYDISGSANESFGTSYSLNVVNNSDFILGPNDKMEILYASNIGGNCTIAYYENRSSITNYTPLTVSTTDAGIFPLESRTIYGPTHILAFRTSNNPIIYRIIRESDLNREETKFSISLNNEGDRMAVGYKEDGSNAVIRVYQFNGSDWDQLGTDID